MAAALDDLALFQHQNGVGVADGGQAVGDHEDRAAADQAVEAALDKLFCAGVIVAGIVVGVM